MAHPTHISLTYVHYPMVKCITRSLHSAEDYRHLRRKSYDRPKLFVLEHFAASAEMLGVLCVHMLRESAEVRLAKHSNVGWQKASVSLLISSPAALSDRFGLCAARQPLTKGIPPL